MIAASVGSVIYTGWIDASSNEYIGVADFVAPDQVMGHAGHDQRDVGYTALAAASDGTIIVAAYTAQGQSFIEVLDANLQAIGGQTATSIGVLGPRAVAMTLSPTGPVAAVTGNNLQNNLGQVVPVNADGTLGTPVGGGAFNIASSIVNVGNRLAVVNSTMANNCAVSTFDLAVTARGAAAGWGTAGQCTQGMLGYSPGRADALLVRHDMTNGDLNHVVATRNGTSYTIPGESRLRNPGNEPRPVGVTDGYWVSYETGGTLEAAHVDFAGVIGTVVPLGPLTSLTAHETVVHAGEPYAIWVQDGLELAHLCP